MSLNLKKKSFDQFKFFFLKDNYTYRSSSKETLYHSMNNQSPSFLNKLEKFQNILLINFFYEKKTNIYSQQTLALCSDLFFNYFSQEEIHSHFLPEIKNQEIDLFFFFNAYGSYIDVSSNLLLNGKIKLSVAQMDLLCIKKYLHSLEKTTFYSQIHYSYFANTRQKQIIKQKEEEKFKREELKKLNLMQEVQLKKLNGLPFFELQKEIFEIKKKKISKELFLYLVDQKIDTETKTKINYVWGLNEKDLFISKG